MKREVNMKKIVTYDIYEPDLEKLCQAVSRLNIENCIVYGIGENGLYFSKCLQAIGTEIQFYVDVKAGDNTYFRGKPIISPKNLSKQYSGEYIVVSPNVHTSIVEFLREVGVATDRIILPFYKRESVTVDYGYHLGEASKDIDYEKSVTKPPVVTITSIIYNTAEYLLRRSFESILRQTYRDYVYVIIINGATDRSYEIAKEYEHLDARIKVIRLAKNYVWTDLELIKTIKNNLFGKYWCQLDGDDYYGEDYLECAVGVGEINKADMVAVRTMAIAADSEFDLMKKDMSFDGKDKLWFYHGDPPCHAFSQNHIMEEFALGRLSGTWWGKLWAMKVTERYFDDLMNMKDEIRGCYFRLDTAMTYKMLTLCERVYFSDKVFHFQSYSPGRTSYSKAPTEWLMSLWYVYKDLKLRFFRWYDYDTAMRYIRSFLKIFTKWMFARRGLLDDIEQSPYKNAIMHNLQEIYRNDIFMSFVINKSRTDETYRLFYKEICKICGSTVKQEKVGLYASDRTFNRIIGYGAKGENAGNVIRMLMDSAIFPTELWDRNGDDKLIKRPDPNSLSKDDLVLIFPSNAEAVRSIKKDLENCKAKIVEYEELPQWILEYK
ncbi:MAG: glycosyltransferase family 2 protein [Firmicutes bacterium]|nr:glycosyltransferase family 2 protein [Bacillota bacterium]